MRGKARAYSLLELLIALFLVFGASLYLFSLYAFGAQATSDTQALTIATFLAQAKMEEIQDQPWSPNSRDREGNFEAPYALYRWQLEVEDFNGHLQLLKLRVWLQGSFINCRLWRLGGAHTGLDVEAQEYDSQQVWTLASGDDPFWQRNSWLEALLRPRPHLPATWRSGQAAGHPGQGLLGLSHAWEPKVAKLTFDGEGEPLGARVWELPAPQPGYPPYWRGLASDKMGYRVWGADGANRALWSWGASQPMPTSPQVGRDLFISQRLPLGDLRGIASDQFGSTLWLCEGRERRLRPFYWGAPLRGVEDLEEAGAGAYWGEPLRPPFAGVGVLQGVACNSWGSVLYTLDNAYLYLYLFSDSAAGSWQRVKLPPALQRERPRALWTDPGHSRLYLYTLAGGLWQWTPDNRGRLKAAALQPLPWR